MFKETKCCILHISHFEDFGLQFTMFTMFPLYSLHTSHLVPLPLVLHLPGQTAGEDDAHNLEDRHHCQTAGDGRDTARDQEVEAAGGHLGTGCLRTGGGGVAAAGERGASSEVIEILHSTALQAGHYLVPQDSHAVLSSCKTDQQLLN